MYVFKALCNVDKGRSKIELTPVIIPSSRSSQRHLRIAFQVTI